MQTTEDGKTDVKYEKPREGGYPRAVDGTSCAPAGLAAYLSPRKRHSGSGACVCFTAFPSRCSFLPNIEPKLPRRISGCEALFLCRALDHGRWNESFRLHAAGRVRRLKGQWTAGRRPYKLRPDLVALEDGGTRCPIVGILLRKSVPAQVYPPSVNTVFSFPNQIVGLRAKGGSYASQPGLVQEQRLFAVAFRKIQADLGMSGRPEPKAMASRD